MPKCPQNAWQCSGAARQDLQSSISQAINHSIAFFCFLFAMQHEGNSFSDRRRVALPTFSALHETMSVAAAAAAAVAVAASIAVGGPVGPA